MVASREQRHTRRRKVGRPYQEALPVARVAAEVWRTQLPVVSGSALPGASPAALHAVVWGPPRHGGGDNGCHPEQSSNRGRHGRGDAFLRVCLSPGPPFVPSEASPGIVPGLAGRRGGQPRVPGEVAELGGIWLRERSLVSDGDSDERLEPGGGCRGWVPRLGRCGAGERCLLERSQAPAPGCLVRPGRRLVTAGHGPGVGISGEEFRAVEKFGQDEFGQKKKYLQNTCYGCCMSVLGLL